MPDSWQPVPVILPISGRPLRMTKQRWPSLTRSMAPVTATMAWLRWAKSLTKATAESRFSSDTASDTSASTPRVLPLPRARVLISEMLPRITVKGSFSISSTAVLVRRAEAPAPTGSSSSTWCSCAAFFPARSIPWMLRWFRVPMLMFSPPQMEVMSSTSSGSSDMMGLPPQASRMLATSLTVT